MLDIIPAQTQQELDRCLNLRHAAVSEPSAEAGIPYVKMRKEC